MAINLNDFIYKFRLNSNRKDKVYRVTCKSCGVDRGYFAKNLAELNCIDCQMIEQSKLRSGIEPIAATKASIKSRTGRPLKDSVKLKISTANTGKKRSYEHRKLNSCKKQGISLEDFKGFIYQTEDPKRSKYKLERWNLRAFEKANFTCDLCNKIGGKFNGHHLDNWKQFPDKRYDLTNIACLCIKCHKGFHSHYGTHDNTKEQYLEFKEKICRING